MNDKEKKCGTALPSMETLVGTSADQEKAMKLMASIFADMEQFVGKSREIEVTVGGRDIMIRLEEPICMVLEEISRIEKIGLSELCERIIADAPKRSAPESLLRAYVIDYLRRSAMGESHGRQPRFTH